MKERLARYMAHSAELEKFTRLVERGDFSALRHYFAMVLSTQPAPYQLNALADSEIAAVVHQERFDVILPRDLPPESLKQIANLVDVSTVNITPQTTKQSLKLLLCGNNPDETMPADSHDAQCELLTRTVMAVQGVSEKPSGELEGENSITIPLLPKPEIPVQVVFKEGVSRENAIAALQSAGKI